MNTLFHFFFSYIIVELAYGNAQQYLIPIILASVLLDLDHIPYLFRKGSKMLQEGLGEHSRTFLHEMPGLALVSAACIPLYFLVELGLARAVILSVLLHYTLDFTVGRSRPFHPFSKIVMVSSIVPQTMREKRIFEIGATILGGVLFWLLLAR